MAVSIHTYKGIKNSVIAFIHLEEDMSVLFAVINER